MSLVLKTSPVGIDFTINQIQNRLFSNLTNKGIGDWTTDNYESYPRAYVNPKFSGTIPEVYTGGREYIEVLMDDTFTASSFFLVENTRPFDEQFSQTVSIIFQADIEKLFPNIVHRADEEMHKDIIDALTGTEFETFIEDLTLGIDSVYSALDIPDEYIEKVKWDDMSNYHVVKLDLEVPYEYCISN